MNTQLDLHAGVILKPFLESSGIRVFTGTVIERANGDQHIESIELSNGQSMATNLLLICTGIRANARLATAAGLDVNRGIVVDEYMRTSDSDIYSAGDAAERPGSVSGLWATGSEQGKVAAAHIAGHEQPCTDVAIPPVQLKVQGIDLKCFATPDDSEPAESYTDGDLDNYRWKHIVVRDGNLSGGVFVNSARTANAAIAMARNSDRQVSREAIAAIMQKDPGNRVGW